MAAMKKTTAVKAVETKAEPVKKIEAAAPAKALEEKSVMPETKEKTKEMTEDKVKETPVAGKTETADAVKEAEKPAPKKRGRKPKSETEKAEVKSAVKAEKPAPRKTAATAAKTAGKEERKASIHLQYAGKSYSNEDLLKIAGDIWEFDLNRKPADLKKIDLYVKPEENTVYYVFNESEEGSFHI